VIVPPKEVTGCLFRRVEHSDVERGLSPVDAAGTVAEVSRLALQNRFAGNRSIPALSVVVDNAVTKRASGMCHDRARSPTRSAIFLGVSRRLFSNVIGLATGFPNFGVGRERVQVIPVEKLTR